MSTATLVDSLVDGILDGKASLKVRSAAARGALPLPRAALARLFLHLRDDADEQVRRDAEASLAGLDAGAVRETLADPDCAPGVLTHFAKQAVRDEALAESIAFHAAVPAEALSLLAGTGSAAVVDLVLTNQERLLSVGGLIERMMVNPALRADQRGKILELLDRATKARERRAGSEVPGEADDDEATDTEAEFEEAAQLLDIDVGELLARSEIVDGEEFEQAEEPEIRSAYRKIVTLNSAQKAVLAMKGGREERMILIRDTNKIVALGVLKNARITDGEVETIASMRNVSDHVLRVVGSHRDWVKNYAVIHGLVCNPRTPQGIAMNFVSRMTNRDLKFLAKSRDVPELIRRMAKRTVDTRTQNRPAFRKH